MDDFPFIDLKAQYETYKEEIDLAIREVIESTSFIGGKKLIEFERNLANYVGVKEAVGCSSGTSALLLALMALGIKEDDEVIVPSFTFIATAEMVSLLKARPVFADINLFDYNIDINSIECLVNDKTKAIIAVSMFGQMPDLETLSKFCNDKNIALIEDGAQSFGANQNGKKSCSIAQISCTSFFPSKPLGAYGDAGAVFSDDENIANLVRTYLNHGQIERYKHKLIGFNGRLDTIQAAILNVKLKYLNKEIEKRCQIADFYNKNLKNVILPQLKEGFTSVYAQYSIRVKNRDDVIRVLDSKGIPSAIHYPLGLHLQEAFLDYNTISLPNTELLSKEILSLPMSAFLKQSHQEIVIETINNIARI
ncbi:DegT/DnrJ/EryC1/StrS aminotransferase family protein [Helicobacter sp. MIT 14-3879]|uniref:DegT/DnrJ/EryC1/StrS family aminotransferase n=1 Tax=Helicobacter sp. MIT 14-3879 TaxID=2040649 RepID=UPI000E1F8779|nr:DegT/DnrJ/EryC1/StrS aminotransferase family protein [Helicobacter sp. MIT 14-3879]RDU62072.1 aminotransferase DegT [Helicobacter sp. MIT 14-3879]